MAVKLRSPLSDEELIKIIVEQGKTGMYGILYDRYADKVYRKCLSFEKDRDAAQDLAHDILIKVFVQLAKFESRSRFSTWLYSITYNYCVEYIRKKSKLQTSQLDEERDDFTDTDDPAFLEMQSEALAQALQKVSPEDKMILLMKYQDDISIKELMTILNISESAVKMRLARARGRVKEIIDAMKWDEN